MISPRLLLLLLSASALLSCFSAPARASDEPAPAAFGAEALGALAHVHAFGTAADGSTLHALALGRDPERLAGRRGLLLVAGLDGRRRGDGELLVEVVRALERRGDLDERLGDALLLVVPRANPAGLASTPPHAGNGAPDDRDRDGRVDEDGPADLDGDGRVLWMRVPDGAGGWVIDAHDPRALRAPRAADGERATHRVLREGTDVDGDGAYHEDDAGGTEPDRNFAHRWQEHAAGTGDYPLQAPEAHALADLVLEHPGLLGVLVLGESDTLAKAPKVDKQPPRRGSGYRERLDGVLQEDADTLAQLGARLDAAGDGDHGVQGDDLHDGGLLAWTYHEAGRWPLGVVPWTPPEDFPPEEEAAAQPEGEGGGGDVGEEPTASDAPGDDPRVGETREDLESKRDTIDESGDAVDGAAESERSAADASSDDEPATDASSPAPAALLAWLDREGRTEQAFTPWTAFEHPQLGAVEIGGLHPLVPFDGPWDPAARTALAERVAAFALQVLDDFPRVVVEDLRVEPRGDGAWRVSLALVNVGRLPTSSRFAADTRTARPLRVSLGLPDGAARLAGPAELLIDRLEGLGGRRELHWVVAGAAPGDVLHLRLDADTVPDLEQEIALP